MASCQDNRSGPLGRGNHLGLDGKWIGAVSLRRMLDEADPEQTVECGGLLGGLSAYHIRALCDSPWEGGAGYTPEQVGRMTLDQAWFRLCDLDLLKNAEERWKARKQEEAPEGEGVLVRLADGTLKRLPVGEKSLAQQLQQSQPKREGRRARRRRLKNENR